MGFIYDKCRSLYYFLSPLARKQAKIERMIAALKIELCVTNQAVEALSNRLVNVLSYYNEYDQKYENMQDKVMKVCQKIEQLEENNLIIKRIEDNQNCILDILHLANKDTYSLDENADEEDYLNMQRKQYNDEEIAPEDIVGQYNWHENYPYETFLLYRNGDVRKPLFDNLKDKKALDFGCGPGRMVKRMSAIFGQVDGCDISERMLRVARERVPDCDFYLTNGDDLGMVPRNYYDFIYSTISMQHIASYSIRRSILKCIKDALKEGGMFTLQLAYNKDFPYVKVKGKIVINENEVTVAGRQAMASYFANDYGANVTNGFHDVGIGEGDIDVIKADFEDVFNNVAIWFSNVSNYYRNLDGATHGSYWATDWMYVHGEKLISDD